MRRMREWMDESVDDGKGGSEEEREKESKDER